tara:strand:+ start:175 stop:312 length:138 start_codon:yes stop_codon:yes gene_type:complete
LSKNISVKASDKSAGKGIIRIQKIVDELKRELDALTKRVVTLEND